MVLKVHDDDDDDDDGDDDVGLNVLGCRADTLGTINLNVHRYHKAY